MYAAGRRTLAADATSKAGLGDADSGELYSPPRPDLRRGYRCSGQAEGPDIGTVGRCRLQDVK